MEKEINSSIRYATFDGVAIAQTLGDYINLQLKINSGDLEYTERIRNLYQSAREELVGIERGDEILEVLDSSLGWLVDFKGGKKDARE